MRICADENVSPVLSDLIRATLLGSSHTLETVDDFQARGVDDEIWVKRFASEGGQAIIGADGRMLTRPHEVVAIAESGVRLIVLPQQWARQPKHLQVAYLFFWWPRIEATFEAMQPRQCFKAPWTWVDKPLQMEKINFQSAYQKVRKQKP